jgi:hypothetical protein
MLVIRKLSRKSDEYVQAEIVKQNIETNVQEESCVEEKCVNSSPELIGKMGEEKVEKYLRKLSKNYYISKQFELYWDRGRRVDHVVVSDDVLFVIETKKYSGIFNYWQNNDGRWFRYLKKRKIDECDNPFLQVVGYSNSINDYLRRNGIKPVIIQPIVVSVGDLKLTNIQSNVPFLRYWEICSYIMNYYTPYKMSKINKERLLEVIQRGEERRASHHSQEEATDAA